MAVFERKRSPTTFYESRSENVFDQTLLCCHSEMNELFVYELAQKTNVKKVYCDPSSIPLLRSLQLFVFC